MLVKYLFAVCLYPQVYFASCEFGPTHFRCIESFFNMVSVHSLSGFVGTVCIYTSHICALDLHVFTQANVFFQSGREGSDAACEMLFLTVCNIVHDWFHQLYVNTSEAKKAAYVPSKTSFRCKSIRGRNESLTYSRTGFHLAVWASF